MKILTQFYNILVLDIWDFNLSENKMLKVFVYSDNAMFIFSVACPMPPGRVNLCWITKELKGGTFSSQCWTVCPKQAIIFINR